MDRLKKMLLDSQGYIDKLHKTVYDKNRRMNEMQDHIYFLEDELYAITQEGNVQQENNAQELNTMVYDEAV
ncbi:hypothetical protein [Flammeovirga aprica]|uniref:Uncharacterized protein n=1 Tax=Flammeovirga aprica JL-4 TaxID=694437 RepID=A0A7X9RUC7_9BACT|nr:hypothetical protein [Flammeovirga aprica]NME68867.1 hypothetical protein [Flammeovirga aprica JL-4]